MSIDERKGRDGKVEYEVSFSERRLEDIVARLNRFERADEKPFEAVADDLGVQPARLRAVPAAAGPVDVERVHGEAAPPVPSVALSALGVVGPQSVARLARSGRGAGQGAARRRRRRTMPRSRSRRRASTAISASLEYYRARARRRERGGFLPDLRQRVLALCRRQAKAAAKGDASRSSSRASCRSSRRRWRRSRKAVIPRRSRASRACSRARASRCCCRGCR